MLDRPHTSPEPSDTDASRSQPVTQLLYHSVSRDGAASALQMSDILAEARPANARDGVTGVLTSVDGRFVQIVEGPGEAIDRLFDRLRRDPRHTELAVVERRQARSRLFGDWDMVSPRLAPGELSALALLMQDEAAGIDAYAQVLARAVAQQDAVLEARSLPLGARRRESQPSPVPGIDQNT